MRFLKAMTNIYHRYLDLPFEIKPPDFFQECGDIVLHQNLNHLDYPDIDSFFDGLGLYCEIRECFYTPPFGKVPIHTDHGSYTNHAKINVTWGPEEGVIQWWKSDIVEEKTINDNIENTSSYHHNLWSKEEDSILLYEANTNIPSLVNVGILHGTNNPTLSGRWTLCFVPRIIKEQSYVRWDNALKIFQNYIR